MSNDAMRYQGIGIAGAQLGYPREKDPTVENIFDAKKALAKRADALRAQLNMVPKWRAELDRIETMLAADANVSEDA